jgi:hypothetical protein
MSTNYIEELETQLEEAKKAATPVHVEVIKEDDQERVSVSSNGTTRTDYLGGQPQQVLGKAQPVPEKRLVDIPWNKDNGRLLKDTETEREAKLKSGTIRTDVK